MKKVVLSAAMASILALGLFSLFSPPANADLQCLVLCYNEVADCKADAFEFCNGDQQCMQNIIQNVCNRINCLSICGPCPL